MKKTTPLLAPAIAAFICVLFINLAGCGERTDSNTQGAAPGARARELTQEEHFAQLKKRAESGNAEAQFALGWIYMRGEGYTGTTYMRDVPKDVEKAHDLYQKAAAQGHVNAQYNLGMLYKLGLGVKEDADKAFMWLQKAAAQGNDIAQYNVGAMYADGAGVERNLARACAWVALAAAQGNEKARKNYFAIEPKLTPAERDEARRLAANWKKGDVI